ncbi:MAG: GldG family protein [Candidatus Hydrogenedentes bacterium]|nr:GldG family protein [Candidatus Hydrogenedentota bacterium]
MRRINTARTVTGLAALVALVAGVNLGVLKSDAFSPLVLVPLAVGIVAGIAWVVLILTTISKESSREGKSLYGLGAVVSSVLFLGICVVIYAFAEHMGKSWDLTKEGRRNLSPQTIQVLQTLDQDVAVTASFIQVEDELVSIAHGKTKRFLDQCGRYTSHLKVEFLDPQLAPERLTAMKVTHASTQGTVVLTCGVNQKVIMLSGGSPRLEERDFTNALINVVRKSRPKIGFLTGHGERSIDEGDTKNGGSMLKQLLEAESYQPERMAIRISDPEITAEYDAIVINGLGVGGAQSDLHPEEIRALDEYVDRGGRVLVLLDPWRKLASSAASEQLVPWLARRLGIVVGGDMAVSPESRWNIEMSADGSAFGERPNESDFLGCYNAGHRITKNSDQKLVFSVARTVSAAEKVPANVVATELIRTTPNFYAEQDIEMLFTAGKAAKAPSERGGPLPLAVAATVKTDFALNDSGQTRDARVVVVGNSAFASNGQIHLPGNLNFVLNVFAWLTESEDLIAIRPSGKEDPAIVLSEGDQRTVVYVAVLGTVQAVVAAGLIAYGLRRKYQ